MHSVQGGEGGVGQVNNSCRPTVAWTYDQEVVSCAPSQSRRALVIPPRPARRGRSAPLLTRILLPSSPRLHRTLLPHDCFCRSWLMRGTS